MDRRALLRSAVLTGVVASGLAVAAEPIAASALQPAAKPDKAKGPDTRNIRYTQWTSTTDLPPSASKSPALLRGPSGQSMVIRRARNQANRN